MLNFRRININDRERAEEYLKLSDFQGCEYCFANNLAWHRLNDTEVAFYRQFYISKSVDGNTIYFTYPAGGGNIFDFIDSQLVPYCKNSDIPLVICGVTKQNAELLKEHYGERAEISYDRDNSDYIYNADDLINLAGKKYHGKRNHIKRFKEKPWHYENLTPEHFENCIKFAAEFYNKGNSYTEFSAVVEQFAIDTYFKYYEQLNLKGGVLFREEKLVGFCIGERLNSNTIVVHIEKALAEIQGAYPTLCNEFLKANAQEFKYVNREEDLGIEGLRKSKLSYHPCFLTEKHTVKINY